MLPSQMTRGPLGDAGVCVSRESGDWGEDMCLCICHLSRCLWGTLWLQRPECCPGTRRAYLQCLKSHSFDCVHMCALCPRGDQREILRSQSLSALWVSRQSSGYWAWWQCLYPLDSQDFNRPGHREGQFPLGLGYFVSTNLFLSVWPGLREIEAESHRTAQRCTLGSGYVLPIALGPDLSAVSGLKSRGPESWGSDTQAGQNQSYLPWPARGSRTAAQAMPAKDSGKCRSLSHSSVSVLYTCTMPVTLFSLQL